jgi:hypothetical protein
MQETGSTPASQSEKTQLTMERKNSADFPQEVWSLFDRYVHGEMDRRTFLDRLQVFAIGGLTATAIFELIRPNYAWATQGSETDSSQANFLRGTRF